MERGGKRQEMGKEQHGEPGLCPSSLSSAAACQGPTLTLKKKARTSHVNSIVHFQRLHLCIPGEDEMVRWHH